MNDQELAEAIKKAPIEYFYTDSACFERLLKAAKIEDEIAVDLLLIVQKLLDL